MNQGESAAKMESQTCASRGTANLKHPCLARQLERCASEEGGDHGRGIRRRYQRRRRRRRRRGACEESDGGGFLASTTIAVSLPLLLVARGRGGGGTRATAEAFQPIPTTGRQSFQQYRRRISSPNGQQLELSATDVDGMCPLLVNGRQRTRKGWTGLRLVVPQQQEAGYECTSRCGKRRRKRRLATSSSTLHSLPDWLSEGEIRLAETDPFRLTTKPVDEFLDASPFLRHQYLTLSSSATSGGGGDVSLVDRLLACLHTSLALGTWGGLSLLVLYAFGRHLRIRDEEAQEEVGTAMEECPQEQVTDVVVQLQQKRSVIYPVLEQLEKKKEKQTVEVLDNALSIVEQKSRNGHRVNAVQGKHNSHSHHEKSDDLDDKDVVDVNLNVNETFAADDSIHVKSGDLKDKDVVDVNVNETFAADDSIDIPSIMMLKRRNDEASTIDDVRAVTIEPLTMPHVGESGGESGRGGHWQRRNSNGEHEKAESEIMAQLDSKLEMNRENGHVVANGAPHNTKAANDDRPSCVNGMGGRVREHFETREKQMWEADVAAMDEGQTQGGGDDAADALAAEYGAGQDAAVLTAGTSQGPAESVDKNSAPHRKGDERNESIGSLAEEKVPQIDETVASHEVDADTPYHVTSKVHESVTSPEDSFEPHGIAMEAAIAEEEGKGQVADLHSGGAAEVEASRTYWEETEVFVPANTALSAEQYEANRRLWKRRHMEDMELIKAFLADKKEPRSVATSPDEEGSATDDPLTPQESSRHPVPGRKREVQFKKRARPNAAGKHVEDDIGTFRSLWRRGRGNDQKATKESNEPGEIGQTKVQEDQDRASSRDWDVNEELEVMSASLGSKIEEGPPNVMAPHKQPAGRDNASTRRPQGVEKMALWRRDESHFSNVATAVSAYLTRPGVIYAAIAVVLLRRVLIHALRASVLWF